MAGSPPLITDARAATGEAYYAASVLAHFDDADLAAGETHTATIDWGDGSPTQAVAQRERRE